MVGNLWSSATVLSVSASLCTWVCVQGHLIYLYSPLSQEVSTASEEILKKLRERRPEEKEKKNPDVITWQPPEIASKKRTITWRWREVKHRRKGTQRRFGNIRNSVIAVGTLSWIWGAQKVFWWREKYSNYQTGLQRRRTLLSGYLFASGTRLRQKEFKLSLCFLTKQITHKCFPNFHWQVTQLHQCSVSWGPHTASSAALRKWAWKGSALTNTDKHLQYGNLLRIFWVYFKPEITEKLWTQHWDYHLLSWYRKLLGKQVLIYTSSRVCLHLMDVSPTFTLLLLCFWSLPTSAGNIWLFSC